jgi:putative ABC transport system permease protein
MNSLLENIRIALSALVSNKLRAVLTTLGIGIGVAAVIVLVSLGNAVQDYIHRQFIGAGADLITVSNGAGFGGRSDSASIKLGMHDVALLQNPNNAPGVLSVVPLLSVRTTTSFQGNSTTTSVTGTQDTYFALQNRTIASGRLFDTTDEQNNGRVVVLGQTTVNNLFTNGEDPIGQSITISGDPFKVIGVLVPAGASNTGQDQDDTILVPISTAQTKLTTARNVFGDFPVSTIYVKVADVNTVPDLSNTITQVLRTSHALKPIDDNDFSLSNAQATLNSLSAIAGALTAFLAVIGGISLFVGGIGVMNIMLVTVTERTREIGLRKALGAKFRDILSQFLTESVVLCFVGGFAGFLLSFAIIALLDKLASDLRPTMSAFSVVLAISVVTMVGVFFGMYPASRAAAMSPIAALRSD